MSATVAAHAPYLAALFGFLVGAAGGGALLGYGVGRERGRK